MFNKHDSHAAFVRVYSIYNSIVTNSYSAMSNKTVSQRLPKPNGIGRESTFNRFFYALSNCFG